MFDVKDPVPDVFTMYSMEFLQRIFEDAYDNDFPLKNNWLKDLQPDIYRNIRRALAKEVVTIEDITPYRKIDSLMFGLYVPFEEIPLHLNYDYENAPVLNKVLAIRLEVRV